MESLAKIVVGILATIGALYVGTMIFAFIVDPCDSQYLATLDSPDQERTATVTLRSCSDNPATELRVTVLNSDNRNLSHYAVLGENPATTEVYLEWSDSRALILHYPPVLAIDNKPGSVGDVRIRFEQIER